MPANEPMTAAHVERLLALRDAEPLPLPWALLQLVAGALTLAAEYEDPLPTHAEGLKVFADEQARMAVYEEAGAARTVAAADIWRSVFAAQRTAAAQALWEQLQEEMVL